jgi:hypothetical protein
MKGMIMLTGLWVVVGITWGMVLILHFQPPINPALIHDLVASELAGAHR